MNQTNEVVWCPLLNDAASTCWQRMLLIKYYKVSEFFKRTADYVVVPQSASAIVCLGRPVCETTCGP